MYARLLCLYTVNFEGDRNGSMGDVNGIWSYLGRNKYYQYYNYTTQRTWKQQDRKHK